MAEDSAKGDDAAAAAKERAAAEEAAKWQQMALRMQQQRAGAASAPAAKLAPDADAAKSSLGTSDLSSLEGTVRAQLRPRPSPTTRNSFLAQL